MKDSTSNKVEQSAHHPFNFAPLFDSEAPWDKDQLGDALHWIRQVIALLCGAIPLVGGIWILLFLAISSTFVYGYYSLILKVDEEDFGGHGTLLMEGLFASFTLFLLSWIVVYSLGHF